VHVRRSALIGRSAEEVFDMIEAAEHYPAFMPWCTAVAVLERTDDVVAATLTLRFGGVQFDMTTRNPKRRPEWLSVRLTRGPFRRFEGNWHVKGLACDACKVEFDLSYEFAGALMDRAAGRMFDGIADRIVDAFARRAEHTAATAVLPQPEGAEALARS
jgi:ribosome-associated toxin RatA of RatAB toxin-antitoxin module